jgi:hypothetical protein
MPSNSCTNYQVRPGSVGPNVTELGGFCESEQRDYDLARSRRYPFSGSTSISQYICMTFAYVTTMYTLRVLLVQSGAFVHRYRSLGRSTLLVGCRGPVTIYRLGN